MEQDPFEKLNDAVRNCARCRLAETRTRTAFGEGNVHAKVMLVGEGPGHDEDLQGRPFVGRAGQLLDRMLEAIGLNRSDINFRKKTVRITGSGDRERSVPVDRDTIRSLTDYDLIARSQMISSKNNDDIFFVSCQGEQMTRQGFWKNLRKYGKEAGLEQEITPHMLRHSFAVYALKKGADIHVLQSIMGHSDIASTNEYNALL